MNNYFYDRVGRFANIISRLILFILPIFLVTAAMAQPCTSPGEPVGCIEIDSPLDGQVWVAIAATLMMSLYFFAKLPQGTNGRDGSVRAYSANLKRRLLLSLRWQVIN